MSSLGQGASRWLSPWERFGQWAIEAHPGGFERPTFFFAVFHTSSFPMAQNRLRVPGNSLLARPLPGPSSWLSWGGSQSGHILPPAGGRGFQGKLRGTQLGVPSSQIY